jgi:hypothetical protein
MRKSMPLLALFGAGLAVLVLIPESVRASPPTEDLGQPNAVVQQVGFRGLTCGRRLKINQLLLEKNCAKPFPALGATGTCAPHCEHNQFYPDRADCMASCQECLNIIEVITELEAKCGQ